MVKASLAPKYRTLNRLRALGLMILHRPLPVIPLLPLLPTNSDPRFALVQIDELAPNPVARLVELRDNTKTDVFSIHIPTETLLESAGAKLVNALNLHRDTYRNQRLCAIFWIPAPHYRAFIEQAFNFADYRTRLIELLPSDLDAPAPSKVQLAIHNLPFARLGRAFYGREQELDALHESLQSSGVAAITQPVSIQGLGGIGKTRLAIEYAWRHLNEYTHVLFARADSPQALQSNLSRLSDNTLLDLPEQHVTDEAERLQAVLQWLEDHDGWLLIADNADDESASQAIVELLPRLKRGVVIVTSRYRRWGSELARMDLNTLTEAQAVGLLLDRTEGDRLQTTDDSRDATLLAKLLGCLPLALEQAAAYVGRHHISLNSYLVLFQDQQQEILSWDDEASMQYPQSLAVTWNASVAKVGRLGRVILRLLAWLAPDPAPIMLLRKSGNLLIEGLGLLDSEEAPVKLTEDQVLDAIDELAALSLLEPVGDFDIAMHRIVQQVERTQVGQSERIQWVALTLRLVDAAIPENSNDVRTWSIIEPVSPHALQTLDAAQEYSVTTPETARLLNKMGLFFFAKALFSEAERLMRLALQIVEQSCGPQHPTVANRLTNLALLLRDIGRVTEAEPLMRRALQIGEQSCGPDHPDVAAAMNNLALLLQDTNRLSEAEPLFRRALQIAEQSYEPDHPNVAKALNNLAQLLKETNRLGEAEPLMQRALKITEQCYGPDHPEVATTLSNLARLFEETSRLSDAESLLRRALQINEESYEPDHPAIAAGLNNLAHILRVTNRLSDAEPLVRRALKIFEQSYGSEHPDVANTLNNLAQLFVETNRLSDAESLLRRALQINEENYGPDHPAVATDLNNLAQILKVTNRLSDAEPLVRRALKIFEESYGSEHPEVATTLNNLALFLKDTNRSIEAEALLMRAHEILDQFTIQTGHEHPKLSSVAANLLAVQGELEG